MVMMINMRGKALLSTAALLMLVFSPLGSCTYRGTTTGSSTTSEHTQHAQDGMKKTANTLNRKLEEMLVQKLLLKGGNDRNLQGEPFMTTRSCGEIIGVVPKEDLLALTDVMLNTLFTPGSPQASFATLARQTLSQSIQYGFQVTKVCLSCDEARALLSEDQLADTSPFGFSSYCSEDDYGSDAHHSTLIFVPMTEEGDLLPGLLRGFVNGRGTAFLLSDAPTENWPTNLAEFIGSNDALQVLQATMDFFPAAIAAGSGAVAISSDFIGYGESYTYNRTYIAPQPYKQAFALGWLAAQQHVSTSSNGCTILDDVASAYGFSEGGLAASFGALAIQRLGVRILSLFTSATPYQPAVVYGNFFETFAGETIASPPCSDDSECQTDEYCSSGNCRGNGECGDVIDCFNPSNEYFTIECVGYLTCDQGMCGKECAESSCPDGSEFVNCFEAPCESTSDSCLAEMPVSCVDDYCGGCNTIRFDAMGKEVCKDAESNSPSNTLFKLIIPFSAFAYSAETPGIANTGSGQRLLADEWMMEGMIDRNVNDWFATPGAIGYGFLPFVPENVTSIINHDMVEIFALGRADGTSNPCLDHVTSTTDKLCLALEEGTFLDEMDNENIVNFPMALCHSEEDEIVPYANLPSLPLLNPFVNIYEAPIAFLAPQGGHIVSRIFCAVGVINSFQVVEDSPILVSPLEDSAMCLPQDPTPAPVSETDPTPAPVADNTPPSSSTTTFSLSRWWMASIIAVNLMFTRSLA